MNFFYTELLEVKIKEVCQSRLPERVKLNPQSKKSETSKRKKCYKCISLPVYSKLMFTSPVAAHSVTKIQVLARISKVVILTDPFISNSYFSKSKYRYQIGSRLAVFNLDHGLRQGHDVLSKAGVPNLLVFEGHIAFWKFAKGPQL